MFVKTWIFASQRYPFYLKKDGTKLILMGKVDVYFLLISVITINLFKKTLTKQAKLQFIQLC